jgi:hypothetical protein
MKKVIKRDKARIIWFEGACWVPRAVRKNESTTTIRVKEVVIIRRLGASDRTVKSRKIWIVVATSPGFVAVPTPIFREGIGKGAAVATTAVPATAAANSKAPIQKRLPHKETIR